MRVLTSSYSLSVIVLAAGASRRFGSQKMLAELDGEPMIRHVLKRVIGVGASAPVVVLGASADRVRACVSECQGINTVYAARWQEGISNSIASGINALSVHTTHAMIVLGDQPLIPQAHYAALARLSESRPEQAVASAYAAHLGVPAIFPSSHFADLITLAGDRGAASLLKRISVLPLVCDEAEMDVDTEADLHAVRRRMRGG